VAAILGFGGTIIIIKVINAVIDLRVKEVEEEVGLDIMEQGRNGIRRLEYYLLETMLCFN
jgi:ammonia channel protein AmtB